MGIQLFIELGSCDQSVTGEIKLVALRTESQAGILPPSVKIATIY